MQKHLYIYVIIYIYMHMYIYTKTSILAHGYSFFQLNSEAHVGYPGIRDRESLHHPLQASNLLCIFSPIKALQGPTWQV